MGAAGQVVLLIDGAAGLENMGKLNFKDCVQIVDFYHAMEHAGQVLAAPIGKHHPDYKKRQRTWAKRLLKDKVEALIKETRREASGRPQAQAVEEALACKFHKRFVAQTSKSAVSRVSKPADAPRNSTRRRFGNRRYSKVGKPALQDLCAFPGSCL